MNGLTRQAAAQIARMTNAVAGRGGLDSEALSPTSSPVSVSDFAGRAANAAVVLAVEPVADGRRGQHHQAREE